MDNQKQLLKKIKQKKELKDITNSIVLDLLDNYLNKHNLSLENLSESYSKLIVKEIRSQLRLYTGRFQKSQKNRKDFLQNDNISELLKTHTSTQERISFYPKLKIIIDGLNIKTILDLACGLNPIALASKNVKYYASDIKEEELKLISDYFKKRKIKGKTFVFNLEKLEEIKSLPSVDLVLLFKILDIVHPKRKVAEKLITELSYRYLIISFPTKKLSGKSMRSPKRNWLKTILEKNNLKFTTFQSENEFFYLVEKNT